MLHNDNEYGTIVQNVTCEWVVKRKAIDFVVRLEKYREPRCSHRGIYRLIISQ